MAELRSPWWSGISPWAPQRPGPIWTREMDWVALWLLDEGLPEGATMAGMARAIGVTRCALERRLAELAIAWLQARSGVQP